MHTGPDQERSEFDELDLRVINAMQVAPRAPWSLIAQAVGADPATVARRWERLRERGLAWTSVYPGLRYVPGAFADLVCEPARLGEVARVLAADPECVTVDITSGERNVLLSIRAADERSLSGYLLDRVAAVPGVRSVRTHLAVSMAVEGSMWRLRALDRLETRVVETRREPLPRDAASGIHLRPWYWDLVRALTPDARASYETLGRAMGVSANSVRRRMDEALGTGGLLMRCEIARSYSGWPVCAWYLAHARAGTLPASAAALASVPEVRAVAVAAGPVNLLIGVWLRSISHVSELEALLERKLPGVEVAERCVVIRPVKQVGHLLREDGTSRGTVPIVLRPRPADV